MNSELNNYNINNPDGAEKVKFNEGKKFYDNDNPNYIKEDYSANIKETSRISETSDGRTKNSDRKASSSVSDNSGSGLDSVSSSASSVSSASTAASTVASTAASATSAIGGSIGALAGTVAASAMAAVIVVAAFVSTLVINLSLAMAGMYSLVFEIEMTGAQEEDFATPIVAVLESDGFYAEQEIYQDTRYITFEELEPGTEYVITIRNEEKVFVKKSYFTATEQVVRGSMSVACDGDDVFIRVEDVSLKTGEFYTITAKDDNGKTLFVKDDVEPNKEFSFKLSEPKNLCFTLSVGGTVYCIDYIQTEPVEPVEPIEPVEPEYDFDNPVWTWADDYSTATVSFAEIHGGEPLEIKAEITESYNQPSCETDGEYVYVATVLYEDEIYSDEQIVAEENTAFGHEYGEPVFEWSEDGEYGYTAKAIFTCLHDETHTLELTADVVQGNYEFTAYVEYDGQSYNDTYYLENPDEPEPQGGVALSLNDGFIGIDPTGYARSHDGSTLIGATSYVSSESDPYIISGTIYADDSLDVYNMTGTKKTIYLRFNDVYIQSGMWATAFRIIANADLDIYIVNENSTTINAGNHYGIEVQSDITVNIYVTGSESFNLSGDNGPFGVSSSSGTCNLYINGVKQ